jgi:hypothetical protein
MNTRRRSIRYSAHSTGGRRVTRRIYLDPDMDEYAKRYAAANGKSVSHLIEELIRWLKDEA